MAKLPKLSDFTDVSGLMSKVKSAIENITGPSSSAASEEALAQEQDPIKAKFLEVEILLNQLHKITVLQNKTMNEIESKYAAVKKLAFETLLSKKEPEPETAISEEPTQKHEDDVKQPPKEP